MAKIISKAQMVQDVVDLLHDLRKRMRTTVESVYDPTRIYEYGVDVKLSF